MWRMRIDNFSDFVSYEVFGSLDFKFGIHDDTSMEQPSFDFI